MLQVWAWHLCWRHGLLLLVLVLAAKDSNCNAPVSGPSVSAKIPYSFSNAPNTSTFYFRLMLGGAGPTAELIDATSEVVSNSLECDLGDCRVVEAVNTTVCPNSAATDPPAILPDLPASTDPKVLPKTAYPNKVPPAPAEPLQESLLVPMPSLVSAPPAPSQLYALQPLPGRRLLELVEWQVTECMVVAQLSMYLTFRNGTGPVKQNQTLELFNSGDFLVEMQKAGFALFNASIVYYMEKSTPPIAAPDASTSPAVVQSGDFSGPKPAVQNSDQVTDISFTLNLIGPDTVVTNDTLLNELYHLLTHLPPSPGAAFFSAPNTVISSAVQAAPIALPPRRHARRALLQDEPMPAPPLTPTARTCETSYPHADIFSLYVSFKVFSVSTPAIPQLQALVNDLAVSNSLLSDLQDTGLRVCNLSLANFNAAPPQIASVTIPGPQPTAPPPVDPAQFLFAARSSSGHDVVVLALDIAVPVGSVVLGVVTAFSVWYYRFNGRATLGKAKGYKKKDSEEESSLFSRSSDLEPEGSAQSIIQKLRSENSSRSLLINMPWSDWKIDPSELTIAAKPDGTEWLLGSGASGRVYKALRNGVQIVAVKVFKEEATRGAITSLTSPYHAAQFKQEISILKSCHDKNIVQFIGACLAEGRTILVTEYLENGDLYKAINSQQGTRYHWYRLQSPDSRPLPNSGMARRVALDVARGLHFLHTRKIVHFDLKSANILLARDFTAKIADVGLARILHDDILSSRREVGTFAWAAPEVLLGQRITEAADIYSFGVLLHELSAVESPRQRHLRPLRIPEEAPPEVGDLINRCLDVDPSRRPTARDLVAALSCLPAIPPFQPFSAADAERQPLYPVVMPL